MYWSPLSVVISSWKPHGKTSASTTVVAIVTLPTWESALKQYRQKQKQRPVHWELRRDFGREFHTSSRCCSQQQQRQQRASERHHTAGGKSESLRRHAEGFPVYYLEETEASVRNNHAWLVTLSIVTWARLFSPPQGMTLHVLVFFSTSPSGFAHGEHL